MPLKSNIYIACILFQYNINQAQQNQFFFTGFLAECIHICMKIGSDIFLVSFICNNTSLIFSFVHENRMVMINHEFYFYEKDGLSNNE